MIVLRTKYPDGNGGLKKVRTGKLVAQGAHASMAWLSSAIREMIRTEGSPIIVITDAHAEGEQVAEELRRIADAPPGVIMVEGKTRVTFPGLTLTDEQKTWIEGKFTKIAVYVETEDELLEVHRAARDAGLTSHLIQDAGDTEFAGVPTHTAVGIGPHDEDKLRPVTGHLKLL